VKSRGLSQPVVIVLIVVGFLLAGVGGYMMLIRPQHAKAADLDRQIADTNSAIDAARALCPISSTGSGTSWTSVAARSTPPAACSRSTRSTSPKRLRHPASRRFAPIS
jgi:type II secretory pathway pseudopilin PulG